MARLATFGLIAVLGAFAAVPLLLQGCGTDEAAIPPPTADGGDGLDGSAPSTGDAAGDAKPAQSCKGDGDCSPGNICVDARCAPGCRSGRDCPADRKICDPSVQPNGACVACITKSDCPAGDTCVGGTCAKSCSSDAECPGQHCDTTLHACVECVSKDQCPIGELCAQDKCVSGCEGDRDCPSQTPRCDTSKPPHGACVQCLQKSDCGSGYDCSNGTCVKSCSGDVDCPGQHCDTVTHQCVQCTDTTQCPLGNVCSQDACTPGCTGDRDCPQGTPRCDTSVQPHGACVECLGPQDCPQGDSCSGGTCKPPVGGTPMTAIAGATFTMGDTSGADAGASDSTPHQVTVSPYAIETYEVTNDAYRACVTAGACALPQVTTDFNDSSKKNNPVSYVTWDMAETYCQWAGRRLPTEAEWELAARGTADRTYPWGSAAPTCTLTNGTLAQACVGALADVNTHQTGASPYGLQDMAGNAREWTEDWYAAYGFAAQTDPRGPSSGTMKLARGGSWASNDIDLTTYTRPQRDPSQADNYIGFRCAKSKGLVAAAFTWGPNGALQGQTITFDASASSDPIDPQSALTVRWDWNDDGIWDTAPSTTKTATHVFSTSGLITVAALVTNTRGESERALHLLSIAPATGGNGWPCDADAGTGCAANYSCVSGLCREVCSGPGAACSTPGYTCKPDPNNPFPFYYYCLP